MLQGVTHELIPEIYTTYCKQLFPFKAGKFHECLNFTKLKVAKFN